MGKDECVVSKTNVKNVQQKMNEEGRRVVQKPTTSLLLCLPNNPCILCLGAASQKYP